MDAPAIPVDSLRKSLASSNPPIVVDVRRAERFHESAFLLKGALRRDPEKVLEWKKSLPAAASVVVYCVH